MDTGEFLLRTRLDVQALASWMTAGWLAPDRNGARPDFSEVDVARAWLILDLQRIGINDEAIPVVLDLIDQIHGLRRVLRDLLVTMRPPSAVATRPTEGDGVGGPGAGHVASRAGRTH
jgi:chaperone modulatory protein CbpM